MALSYTIIYMYFFESKTKENSYDFLLNIIYSIA